ncbi:MAG: glycogen debranching enzyme N-terminal domain-containing protein, partial [Lentisphaeria bacterium]|nr:glycogen debranching enzyme N-terminal domain-containing protein [Lentisphaeria bacterium]
MTTQSLTPEKSLFFTGETATFSFHGIPATQKGRAVLRTNIGGGTAKFAEQIEKTEANRTPKGSDWHDLEMSRQNDGSFQITLPLTEVGIFEAKCCFLPADKSPAIWSTGSNFRLKVTSNANIAGNGIYCCFVRQWGKWMYLPHSPEQPDFHTLDQEGFTIVPPSGTFRSVIKKLDHIFDTLNCRILQLLPIHPVPMSYGRMGRYGSPFAATDYFAVDPALAEFDTSATPMEQFSELIDAVHARGGRIFMDLPVNHTGWASKLQSEHPDYFLRDENRHFVSPGAWGIVWADLCQLDYRQSKVHDLMAKVFLFWCKRGVDGFRCDAGYMVPQEAWEYIIAKVRNEYPDTTFLLEGLGGPVPVQEKLLEQCGLDWGYSELFQNYTRDAISSYFPYMAASAKRGGTLVNFSETHDNLRLAAGGKAYAKLRFMVNALLSVNGTFGFANGAEFYATEKIDVHQSGALNFGAVDNLCSLINKINILLATHPAFSNDADVSLIQQGPGNVIAALRKVPGSPPLLILINLDCEQGSFVHFPPIAPDGGRELFTGRQCDFINDNGVKKFHLAPAEALCIAFDDFRIPENMPGHSPQEIKLKAALMAQNAALNYTSLPHAAKADGQLLCADPEKFVETVSGISPAPVCHWHYPQDSNRIVMAAPQDILMLHSPVPFIAELTANNITLCRVDSLQQNSGEFFALLRINSRRRRTMPENLNLQITAFENSAVRKISGNILLLADPEKRQIHLSGKWNDAENNFVFGSNINSSYAMFSAQWGKLTSKYDAILAVNDNPEYPVDRYVMFTRCRAWLVVDEYSQELTAKSLENYSAHPGNRAKWEFLVPDGHGGRCTLSVEFRMAFDQNTIELKFHRKMRTDGISPEAKLILRPDLEDRINHTVTRACEGAEKHFPASVTAYPDGFDFHPGSRHLRMKISGGTFHLSPEWHYMTDLPQERYYGMTDKTDLFSPGYFCIPLALGESVSLTAGVGETSGRDANFPEFDFPATLAPEALAIDSLNRFIVRRDGLSTVIAGYPWFLDWGRDTLIVLRGLVKFPEF